MLIPHTLIMLLYMVEFIHAKGHLVKFSFDKVNASNDHIWVRKANIIGPKRKFGYQNQPIRYLM